MKPNDSDKELAERITKEIKLIPNQQSSFAESWIIDSSCINKIAQLLAERRGEENKLLNAKIEWLNRIYVSIKVSHPHLAPDYPGDEKVLQILENSNE